MIIVDLPYHILSAGPQSNRDLQFTLPPVMRHNQYGAIEKSNEIIYCAYLAVQQAVQNKDHVELSRLSDHINTMRSIDLRIAAMVYSKLGALRQKMVETSGVSAVNTLLVAEDRALYVTFIMDDIVQSWDVLCDHVVKVTESIRLPLDRTTEGHRSAPLRV
jgi:hypothetical protein